MKCCKNNHRKGIYNYHYCDCFCHIRSSNTTSGEWIIKGDSNTGGYI